MFGMFLGFAHGNYPAGNGRRKGCGHLSSYPSCLSGSYRVVYIFLKDMICDSLIVYRHEVSRLLRSLRFRVSFVLIVLLFAGGSRLFVSLYMEQQATYKQLVKMRSKRNVS